MATYDAFFNADFTPDFRDFGDFKLGEMLVACYLRVSSCIQAPVTMN